MDAWCAPHSRSAELTSNTSKTRHQKRSAETGGRNGDSIARIPHTEPAHICESSRYRAQSGRLSRVSYLKLDSYFHNLRAWNFEICTRPLSVVMHEGE